MTAAIDATVRAFIVIPAKAGTQWRRLGPRFRGDDVGGRTYGAFLPRRPYGAI